MNKTLSRWLYLLGILAMLLGVAMLAYALVGSEVQVNGPIVPHVAHPFWARLGAIAVGVGALLGLIAWMGALARMAQYSRWIWFVCLVIFPGVGLLFYVFFGPRTPSRRVQRSLTMPPPTPSYGG